jgi:hypothetical protein
MIELQTSVKQDDTTRTRTPKQGYLNLSIVFDTRTSIHIFSQQFNVLFIIWTYSE